MTAYYSENDKYAAQFLRNLIVSGLIAPGDVDERSIVDVTPADLRGYTQCHFFAGIGIWSASLRGSAVGDDQHIWTGSCPCQPFSAAGQGKGFADERHLWPAFHHLIKECRPPIVLGEQVASKDGLQWLDLVQDDMEGTGYAFAAADTCAAGACVDFADSEEGNATLEWISGAVLSCPDPFLAAELRDFAVWARTEIGCGPAHIRQRLYWMAHAECAGREWGRPSETGRWPAFSATERLRDAGIVANANKGQRGWLADSEGRERNWPQAGRQQSDCEPQSSCDVVGMGHADCARSQGWRVGRNYADEESRTEASRSPSLASCNWIICTDGKARPTKPGTLPLAHGYSGRVGLLRAAGNALNKAQAEQFIGCAFEAIGRGVRVDAS